MDDFEELGRKLDRHVDPKDEWARLVTATLIALGNWQTRFDKSFNGAVKFIVTALVTLITSVLGAAAINYLQQEHNAATIASATVHTATAVDQNTQAWREQRAAVADARADAELRALTEINHKLDRR